MVIKITVLLPKSLKDACQERAKSLNMRMDNWIRLAITDELKEPKTNTKTIENRITENKVAKLTLLMSNNLFNTCQAKAERMGINTNTWIRLAIIDELSIKEKNMTTKTERELDLENLQQLQKAGKIDPDVNLEEIADKLPMWRKNSDVASKVAVAIYGRDVDLDKLVHDEDYTARATVASRGRGKDLDKLVHDKDWYVRKSVAQVGRGKDLDILVSDSHWQVRQAVAKHGRPQDLDKLVSDKDYVLRWEVAGRGRNCDLDKLVNDKDVQVRIAVAKHGRLQDLDKLVYDENENVRETVAYLGSLKHLEILADDDSAVVLQTVAQRLLDLLDEQKN